MKAKTYFTFLLFIIFSTQLMGQTTTNDQLGFEDAIFPELAVSGRALAMGNAYICKVDDSASAFYNPAGLGTVRKGHFHMFNIHLESNKGLINTAAGGRASDGASNAMKGLSLDGVRELLHEEGSTDTLTHGRFQTMPNILFRYFTAGFFINRTARATLGTTVNEEFEYAKRTDFGPYAALNLSLFGGVLKFGATGMILNRYEAIGRAPSATTFELEDDDYNKGIMEYVVAGGRLTLPWNMLPTFAAVVHNATNKSFKGRAGGAPEKIKQTVDIGFSITPQIAKTMRFHLEANIKDVGHAHSGVDSKRRLVFGGEIDVKRKFFIRMGYGDGFGSGGLGIKSQHLEFDLTTYAVDTTASGYRGKEDRRYSLSLSYGF